MTIWNSTKMVITVETTMENMTNRATEVRIHSQTLNKMEKNVNPLEKPLTCWKSGSLMKN
jgi:hypothetical protein